MHLRHRWRTLEQNLEVRSGFKLDWIPKERFCLVCGRHQHNYSHGFGSLWFTDGVVIDAVPLLLEWKHRGPWWRIT